MVYYGVVVVTTAQHHPARFETRLRTGLNPYCSVLEIRNGENFWG